MGRKHLYPPSVRHGIPRLGKLPRGWTKTTFGEQLHVVERPVTLDTGTTYQLVTAKRSRGGIVARETLRGDQILTSKQYQVEAGDFITSNRQIIHGACGIVPPELDGAIVSGEYTVLRPKTDINLSYFAHYTHTHYFQKTCFFASVGVDVEKMVFDVDAWLKLPFHLPSKAEQNKIAAILADVDKAISASSKISQQLCLARDCAVLAHLRSVKAPVVELSHIITSIEAGKSPQCEDRPAKPNEIGVLKVGAVSPRGFDPNQNKVVSDESAFSPAMLVQKGDLLMTRANGSPDLIGMSCIVGEISQQLYLSDKTFRISFDVKKIDKRYVDVCLKSRPIRSQIETVTTGGSGSMSNLSQSAIRSLRIQTPSLVEQRRVAALAERFSVAIAAEEQKLSALERVKTELARRLLTGELRVKP